nr:retrovirus-related Pol polyprotein from transposon TNT 1-94 [Tanacetum cinerariifolium]
MPHKLDLVFHDALTTNETVPTVLNVEPSTTNPNKDLSQSNRPSAHIIEDWVSDFEDEYEGEPMPTQNAPSFVQTSEPIKTPRTSVKPVEHPILTENLRKELPKVLVTKPHHKTPNKLLLGRAPSIGSIRPFGCPVTILNTLDPLGKFDGKADEGFLVGYSVNSMPLEYSISMNYQLVVIGNQPNHSAGIKENLDVGKVGKETESAQPYVLLPLWSSGSKDPHNTNADAAFDVKKNKTEVYVSPNPLGKFNGKADEGFLVGYSVSSKFDGKDDKGFFVGYSTNSKAFRVFNRRTRIVEENLHVKFNENTPNIAGSGPNWPFNIDALTKSMNYKPVVVRNQSNSIAGAKACDNVGKTRVEIVPDKDYILVPLWTQDLPFSSSLKDSPSARFKPSGEEEKKYSKDPGNEESEVPSTKEPRVNQEKDANVNNTNNINNVSPTNNAAGIKDNVVDENIVYGCIDDQNIPDLEESGRFSNAMDDDSWADMNNLDTYFQMIKNLEEYRYTQEEGIDYDEVFALVARIEAIRIFLAYASFKDFVVYRMDVKSAFVYGKIKEEVYVCQPLSFEDPDFLDKVYKVEKTASTPMEIHETLLKNEKREDVDEHLYRSMIGSLMCLTSSRTDIMFAVCACASDYTGASLDRKSTTGSYQFLGYRLISWQCKKQTVVANSTTKAKDSNEKKLIQMIKIHTDKNVVDLLTKAFDDSVKKKTVNGEEQLQALVDRKKVIITEATIRRDLQLEDAKGVDCHPIAKIFDQLTLMSTMASAIIFLATNQEFNFSKYIFDNMVKNLESINKFLMYPRRQKSKTYGLKRLYKVSLSARVESSDEKSLGKEDASKQGRNIADIDADKEITLVDETTKDQGRFDDQEMFDTGVLDDEEVVVEKAVADKEVSAVEEVNAASITTPVTTATTTNTAATTLTISMDEITLAKARIKIKTSRPKAKELLYYELAQRLQEKEQEQLIDDEKAGLFMQFLEKKGNSLQLREVNTFVDMDTEVVESSKKTEEIAQEESSKRERDKLEQKSAKK